MPLFWNSRPPGMSAFSERTVQPHGLEVHRGSKSPFDREPPAAAITEPAGPDLRSHDPVPRFVVPGRLRENIPLGFDVELLLEVHVADAGVQLPVSLEADAVQAARDHRFGAPHVGVVGKDDIDEVGESRHQVAEVGVRRVALRKLVGHAVLYRSHGDDNRNHRRERTGIDAIENDLPACHREERRGQNADGPDQGLARCPSRGQRRQRFRRRRCLDGKTRSAPRVPRDPTD